MKTVSFGEKMLAATLSLRPPWIWPRAAYIHVPFCAHRCGYCDFAIAVGQDELMDRYIEAIAIELAMLRQPQPVRTVVSRRRHANLSKHSSDGASACLHSPVATA